ncbi:MAG: DegT/DnrJ/EryC1/StrS family aminotransferase [Ignavibacteriae bacterium]|nr:DegT/DnrJ/EryC1/StrS family aminotransferase [Ignavibacteriota bacterium]MCB9247190.1 DegT/DnrJ/EryC1/StrS family aminotransferase [Ignavibacteriales bacterium]
MKVPFLDLKAQYNSIKDEVLPEIHNVLENTAYVLGKPVFDFEAKFASENGAKHCVALSSGTDGNHVALWALGIGAGDEVIIPANTFIATAWGATLCGATPVFVDCDPESYNIDPKKVEAAITPKTKAIVAVHLYGQAADMDPLNEIAKKHKLFLLEDAAQSHFAEYKGKRIGALSDIASYSFYPGKNLGAYGEGGAITTNNDELATTSKMIRDHGGKEKYNHEILGHNYRMEGIQGAVLGVKLNHLNKWTDGRRRVAAKYRELLSDIDGIKLPTEMDYAKHVYHLFVIQVKGKDGEARTANRDRLQKHLGDNDIASGLHYPLPLHQQKCFAGLGYKYGDFPITEELAEQGLSLPMYPELTDEQLNYISEKVHAFFK